MIEMSETRRLELIVEAVRYCNLVRQMGMPPGDYTKTPREAIYYTWTCRLDSKSKAAKYRSREAVGLKWEVEKFA
jgi:hypothetical protein